MRTTSGSLLQAAALRREGEEVRGQCRSNEPGQPACLPQLSIKTIPACTIATLAAVATILAISAHLDGRYTTMVGSTHTYIVEPRPALAVDSGPRPAVSAAAAAVARGPAEPYHLCVMTRVRNSASMVAEWIEYHKLVGVDHFFIADDCSTDDGQTRAILHKYQDEGLVTFSASQPFNDCLDHHPDENKLFNHLLGMAKPKCRWVGVWDLDEYVTISDPELWDNLQGYLDQQPYDMVRMAWWIMGSDGHERRPPGLIIENYHHGYLQPMHIKSIARSCTVSSWEFSLYPTRFEPNCTLATDANLHKHLTNYQLHDEEKVTQKMEDGSDCLFPAKPVFLKHYMARSFEEYMQGRGALKMTSNGDQNVWAVNPREKWLESWVNGTCKIGDDSTSMMARRVHESMQERVAGAPHSSGGSQRSRKLQLEQTFSV